MRVVCESCQAKYQVSDERVAGKRLKIRCRRCSGTIVIRGDLHATAQVAAAYSEQPVAQPRAQAVAEEWFLSIDEQEHGPLSRSQLTDWLRENPGGWDAYVWREGLGSWVLAREVDELVGEVAGVDNSPTHVAPASQPPHNPFDSSPYMASGGAGAAAGSAYQGAAGWDQPVAEPTHPAQPGYAAAYGAQQDPMIGARNENSVLFSAANLAQVAQSSSYSPAARAGGGGYDDSQVGHATGEASGLIDIRALAGLAAASQPIPLEPQPGPSAGNTGGYDPELVTAVPPAFTPDTLAPVAPEPERRSRAVPLAILGATTIAAAAVVLVAIITRSPSDANTETDAAASAPVEPLAAEPSAPEPAEEEPAAAEAEPLEEAQAAVGSASGEAEEAQEAEEAEEPTAHSGDGSPAARRQGRAERNDGEGRRARRQAAAQDRRTGAPEGKNKKKRGTLSAKVAARKPRGGGGESLDDLLKPGAKADKGADKPDRGGSAGGSDSLDDLLLPKKGKSKPEPEPAAAADGPAPGDDLLDKPKPPPAKDRSMDDLLDMAVADGPKGAPKLPAQPDRSAVLKAMRGVQGAVNKCAKDAGETGVATVEVTVSNSGRVSGANVTGITGPAGSCIARAVRKASFPRFSNPSFSVKFPFRIK